MRPRRLIALAGVVIGCGGAATSAPPARPSSSPAEAAPRAAVVAERDAGTADAGVETAPASGTVAPCANVHTMTRAELATLLDDAPTRPRAVPHYDEARRIDGMRIFGVRRGSRVTALGLQNGDVLSSVNGVPVNLEFELDRSAPSYDLALRRFHDDTEEAVCVRIELVDDAAPPSP